tara:strand:+ start:1008 stop:1670 length:663 start_codon:yes stop_codon:yes gene_type:complete
MGITQQIGASSLIKPGVIDNTAARPASPYEGQVIFQKDTDQLLVWNGTAWVIPNSPAQNPQGLEFISSTTIGTTVSSVTVSSAFSSTYDIYLILISSGVSSSSNAQLKLTLGSTATGYEYGYVFASASSSSGNASTTATFIPVGELNTNIIQSSFQITNPNLAKHSYFSATLGYNIANSNGRSGLTGILKDTTAYTAFTLTPSTGTLTGGTIRVYGYRNS